MKNIPIRGIMGMGKFAIVDDDDFNRVSEYKWHLMKNGYAQNTQYIRGSGHKNQKSYYITMHQFVMGKNKQLPCIDHINGNKLDNRKENLRFCSKSQNAVNSKIRSTNTSGFTGVYWHKQRSKWVAYINFNRKMLYLGLFENKIDAAKKYDEKAHELFGNVARKNF